MIIAIIGCVIIIGAIGGIKYLQIGRMIAQGEQFVPPAVTITTVIATRTEWEQSLTAVGSLAAVHGIMVTAELTGKVVKINFEPGGMAKTGDLLVQQDVSSEEARLQAAEASARLAALSLERFRKLLAQKSTSQAEYDSAEAQFQEATAQVNNIRADIAKKTIRAPFTGRLGIRMVNMGQIVNAGEPIVSLQTLDPIFVDFSLPQEYADQIQAGYHIRLTSDVIPGKEIEGSITAINPEVDEDTRNIKMQATVRNPEERLRPGMFVNVAVVLPNPDSVVMIPATAVLFAPYGDSVFVVEDRKEGSEAREGQKFLRQQLVRLGEKRGDFVAVAKGLKEGETVAGTGVFKLRNGQAVVIDNSTLPKYQLNPEPEDS